MFCAVAILDINKDKDKNFMRIEGIKVPKSKRIEIALTAI